MFKDIYMMLLPFFCLVFAVFDLIEAGQFASGYEKTKRGGKWAFATAMSGIANIILALIFLLNL